MESDGGSDDEMDTTPNGPAPQAFTFEIDVDIDIDSKALRDMVSVDPVLVQGVIQPQQQSSDIVPQVPAAPDWNW